MWKLLIFPIIVPIIVRLVIWVQEESELRREINRMADDDRRFQHMNAPQRRLKWAYYGRVYQRR